MKPKTTYLALLALLISLNVLASDKPVLQVRTIEVLPYGVKSGEKQSGVYYELMNRLLADSGYEFDNRIYPYARIIHELKSGQADLTIMFRYEELVPYVEYIQPLPTLKNVVVGRRTTQISQLNDLHFKALAYLRGATFSEAIDNNPRIFKQMVVDFNQGVNMLANGRVDAIIGPLIPIFGAAAKLQLADDFFGEPLVVSERTPWLQASNKSLEKLDVKKLKSRFTALIEAGLHEAPTEKN